MSTYILQLFILEVFFISLLSTIVMWFPLDISLSFTFHYHHRFHTYLSCSKNDSGWLSTIDSSGYLVFQGKGELFLFAFVCFTFKKQNRNRYEVEMWCLNVQPIWKKKNLRSEQRIHKAWNVTPITEAKTMDWDLN